MYVNARAATASVPGSRAAIGIGGRAGLRGSVPIDGVGDFHGFWR